MPYTQADARAEITQLVANFRANEPSLADAPEAQIEDTYIRRLFRYLNWNTDNTGLAVADWEFVLQRTDEKGKRPDYVLQLDGQPLLVMDAKKVKYDMHDPRWMTQVYAYAYSTQSKTSGKIDFAILTDFQEFILLDCTLYAADPKAVGNFRILDWSCDDYVRHFDTLWELFEKDNLRAAARTRGGPGPAGLWTRYLSPKKVKANRLPPDKAFLAEMDDEKTGWRVRLAKDMKKRNPEADGALITAAVQLLIDRLIFVKALSDREIEDDYLTRLAERVEQSGLAANDAGWFNACRDIFARLNQFYNGSIFEPRPELEAVTVSNKVVREVIRDLQPEHSPYNFAVLPVEILGTIYERFLGRVVRATEKQVKIEDKPEVRKAGGVYYTPQYIVDYIVQNTVSQLLAGCRTPADVAKLKIADPACGSGSFLLGAYSALIHWHETYYGGKDQLTKRDREAAYYDSDGRVRLTAKLKRQILLNNLFGVDIDAQAVEVTRFSLSLKALEDTRRAELAEEVTLFKQTVLPDLRHNIKCGNSLIGNDYFTGLGTLPMFSDKDELMRVRPFDWAHEFPMVFGGSRPAGSASQETRQVLAGGFDAVIGNPPYIRIQTLQETSPEQVAHLKGHYRAASAGNYDIYVVFVEKGLSLLNARGRLGFILPHKFFNAKYGEALRGLIAEGQHLGHVVHFGDQQVFDGATTYTALMFLDKGGNDSFELVKVSDLAGWRADPRPAGSLETRQVSTTGTLPAANVTAAEWNFTVGQGAALFERLSQMPVKLGNVAHLFVGLQTDADDVYILEEIRRDKKRVLCESKYTGHQHWFENEHLKSFLKGSLNIRRYYLSDATKRLIFPYETEGEKSVLIGVKEYKQKYPMTWAYLEECRERLVGRNKGRMGKEWYGYVYKKNHTRFDGAKLLVPSIATGSCFAADFEGIYYFVGSGGGGGGGYGISLDSNVEFSSRYLLGLLNSSLLSAFLKMVSTPFQGGYLALNRQYIEQLPIRPINFSDPADQARHAKMVQLVESMLALHQHQAAAQTQAEQDQLQRQITATDRAIDALVYELYGLTEEEIKVVE